VGSSPLYLAIYGNHPVGLIKFLIENGAFVNEIDVLGNTLLHTCIINGKIQISLYYY